MPSEITTLRVNTTCCFIIDFAYWKKNRKANLLWFLPTIHILCFSWKRERERRKCGEKKAERKCKKKILMVRSWANRREKFFFLLRAYNCRQLWLMYISTRFARFVKQLLRWERICLLGAENKYWLWAYWGSAVVLLLVKQTSIQFFLRGECGWQQDNVCSVLWSKLKKNREKKN